MKVADSACISCIVGSLHEHHELSSPRVKFQTGVTWGRYNRTNHRLQALFQLLSNLLSVIVVDLQTFEILFFLCLKNNASKT